MSSVKNISGQHVHVLVVDDKQIMLDIVLRILDRLGLASVDVAQDGATALDMVQQKTYGLVISDLHMSPVNGLDLLREIRSDDKLRRIPFLLMSGEGNPYTLIAAKNEGLDNFILKPFTPAVLEEKLSAILGRTGFVVARHQQPKGRRAASEVRSTLRVHS